MLCHVIWKIFHSRNSSPVLPPEGIFCKSLYQIYKPIEIYNFVFWYHEGNNSANVYYELVYANKIAIKSIKNPKVKQVHFSFVENRQNTRHGVLEKTSWKCAGDSLDLIVMDPSNSGIFLHPKLQVFNLITYTVWKVFMTPWLVVCILSLLSEKQN